MTRIVFFWVGQDVTTPSFLVKSVRLLHGDDAEIIQLTDQETPEIAGVTHVVRNRLSKNLMVARLEAYAGVEIGHEYTFFTDADLLFIDKLTLEDSSRRDILLIRRLNNIVVNADFPEHYPEFVGKTFLDVMPFLFGAIAVRNARRFFADLLQICLRLPDRFHRWYGDQVSLLEAYKLEPTAFGFLDASVYQLPMNHVGVPDELRSLRRSGIQILHFKGRDHKKMMEPTYRNLLQVVNAPGPR